MQFSYKKTALLAALMGFSAYAFSALPPFEQVQVPACLAKEMPASYKILAENKDFKIVNLPSSQIEKLHLLADKVGCGFFINVTHEIDEVAPLSKEKAALALLNKAPVKSLAEGQSYGINHEETVLAALEKIQPNTIHQTLSHLSSYYNRSSTKQTGVDVADWLKDQFMAMANEYGREDVDAYFVKTGSYYIQPSLVTVIGKNLPGKGIVVGAHMDTLDGRMPGAGDDGTGSSVVMEVSRVLLSSNLELKRPIYIMWYAAEERGLVGSGYVVKEFTNKKIPVQAAIQFDMSGFRNGDDPTMWVFRDYTDKNLSDYVAELIKHYIKVPVKYSKCGYGCSDHASWHKIGVPAAFPVETSFEEHNPYIHTSQDSIEKISLEHMTNFAKLGLAFAIELASE